MNIVREKQDLSVIFRAAFHSKSKDFKEFLRSMIPKKRDQGEVKTDSNKIGFLQGLLSGKK